jgi:hypothetical protein
MNIFPSSLFSHNARAKCLGADVSELEHFDGRDPRYGVFLPNTPGVMAQGLHVRSDRTGNITTWLIQDQITGPEGEVSGWELTPTKNTVDIFPNLKDYVLYVWNT